MEQADVRGKITDKPSLTLARHYPVAPEKVWRAWTDPQALKQWFGADGNEHEAAGVYKEVQLHSKLVFTWSWPRTTPERVSQITILLRSKGGGTDMEFRHEQFFDEAARDGHLRGWSGTFVKLESFLQQA